MKCVDCGFTSFNDEDFTLYGQRGCSSCGGDELRSLDI
jgi:hypothetical protein